jgi:hydrogenase maturation protein HypF
MMAPNPSQLRREIRKRLSIAGVVQGVGFRPFVWRRATRLGLSGWVENDSAGVTAEVQGPAEDVQAFLDDLAEEAPALAIVHRVDVEEVPITPTAARAFVILASESRAAPTVAVSPDIATCDACRAELEDPGNRRYRYPFINCTDCGPRFTIITDLPYDRPLTTMRGFELCAACAAEYVDPADRRFHAQPNACGRCGPAVWFTAAAGGEIATERPASGAVGEQAIEAAQRALRAGDVLAIKGLGGFHLVCDATNEAAVNRLRERKHRIAKPLAVMVADVGRARACAEIDEQERRLLAGRERPIVLLRKRADGGGIAAAVAPGNDFLGLMLPYSPLHHLLCVGMPPLVMTSGNLSEEPIVHDNREAAIRLAPLVDGFLMHDRPIHVPCDDSVVRCVAGMPLPIRRSRGYAPLPVQLERRGPSVLAVGGELKAAVCLARDDQAIMSQHIGDMGNMETLDALARTAEHLMRLFRTTPEIVAADMHPGYLSTQWAMRFAAERKIPFVQVQHHEAHVAALMAEHGRMERPLIGVCFDGTGFGRDGTIWGGEVFAVQGGSFRRAAHLEPFPLPGGDASIRHPWRAALAVLHAAGCNWSARLAPVQAAGEAERRLLGQQLDRNLNCVATSSMGRFFDAVAALAGVKQSITYEAEAAMNLEALAGEAAGEGALYAFTSRAGSPARIGWQGVVREIAADAIAGVPAAEIAARFHRGVAEMVAEACTQLRLEGAGNVVGLTGGVFQNALLLRLAIDELHRAGFEVLCHERVSANDGGLALGQAVLSRTGFSLP